MGFLITRLAHFSSRNANFREVSKKNLCVKIATKKLKNFRFKSCFINKHLHLIFPNNLDTDSSQNLPSNLSDFLCLNQFQNTNISRFLRRRKILRGRIRRFLFLNYPVLLLQTFYTNVARAFIGTTKTRADKCPLKLSGS